jgi:hypothetical protein
MRRWLTGLTVGALCALGAFAAADALRGGRAEVQPRQDPTPAARTVARELDLREPQGILYYSDPDDDCRLHGVALPRLEDAPPPDFTGCEFSLSPDSTAVLPGEVSWSPRGGLYVRESDGMVELGSQGSQPSLRFPGRAPAFMANGTFTYSRGRQVIAWATDCPSDARLFTLPGDNGTVRCPKMVVRLPHPATRLAWLARNRLAAVVRRPDGLSELLLLGGERALPLLLQRGRLERLTVSPAGTYYAVSADGGLLVFRWDGIRMQLPARATQAITWSPDERLAAVATENSVFVLRTLVPGEPVRRLPIRAADLAWR